MINIRSYSYPYKSLAHVEFIIRGGPASRPEIGRRPDKKSINRGEYAAWSFKTSRKERPWQSVWQSDGFWLQRAALKMDYHPPNVHVRTWLLNIDVLPVHEIGLDRPTCTFSTPFSPKMRITAGRLWTILCRAGEQKSIFNYLWAFGVTTSLDL